MKRFPLGHPYQNSPLGWVIYALVSFISFLFGIALLTVGLQSNEIVPVALGIVLLYAGIQSLKQSYYWFADRKHLARQYKLDAANEAMDNKSLLRSITRRK